MTLSLEKENSDLEKVGKSVEFFIQKWVLNLNYTCTCTYICA